MRDRRSWIPAGLKLPVGEISDYEEESVPVLRLVGSVAILFLLVYWIFDLEVGEGGYRSHAIVLAGACLFFALTWTGLFRRHWKLSTWLFGLWLEAMFVLVSASTGDPESRFIAILLSPLATASFLAWGPRWQIAMAGTSVACYLAAVILVPIPTPYDAYRWMGLAAALALAQTTAFFLDRYRIRLRGNVLALEEAARFRQAQMAMMAHDVRGPLGALRGFVNLLQEVGLDASEKSALLSRIGSTAWNMTLAVGNMLDLYRMEQSGTRSGDTILDPNGVIREVAEECAEQAERSGLLLRTELATLPSGGFDAHHLERIVRNLVAYALSRQNEGEVILRTAADEGWIVVEVSDRGPALDDADLARLFEPPFSEDRPGRSGNLGLYVARTMAEADGGALDGALIPAGGLKLVVKLPVAPLAGDKD